MDSFKSISLSDLKDFKEFVPIYASSIIYFIPKTPHLKLVTRNTFIYCSIVFLFYTSSYFFVYLFLNNTFFLMSFT